LYHVPPIFLGCVLRCITGDPADQVPSAINDQPSTINDPRSTIKYIIKHLSGRKSEALQG
jgi:hypothetical protein